MTVGTASELDVLFQCIGPAVLPRVRQLHAPKRELGTAAHLFLERTGDGMDHAEALALIEQDDHREYCAAIDISRIPRGAVEVAFAIDVVTGKARELGRRLGRQYPT